jgi:hypothetical protein
MILTSGIIVSRPARSLQNKRRSGRDKALYLLRWQAFFFALGALFYLVCD